MNQLKTLFLLAVLTLSWGGNWPAMKAAVAEIPVWTFRSICLVVGGAILLVMVRLRGEPLAVPRAERRPLVLAALLNVAVWQLCSAYGLTFMKAGRASIIAFTMPLWAVILDRLLFGERVPRSKALALALGLAGLAVLIGPDLAHLAASPAGALFMLAASITWAAGTLVLKRNRWTIPTMALTAWQITLASLPVVVGALLLEMPVRITGLSVAGAAGLVYATLVLWFAEGIHRTSIAAPPLRPWYRHKQGLCFADVLRAAQRALTPLDVLDPRRSLANLRQRQQPARRTGESRLRRAA